MLNEDKFEIYLGNWKFLLLCIYTLGRKKNQMKVFQMLGARGKNPVAFNYWRRRRVCFDRASPHII